MWDVWCVRVCWWECVECVGVSVLECEPDPSHSLTDEGHLVWEDHCGLLAHSFLQHSRDLVTSQTHE